MNQRINRLLFFLFSTEFVFCFLFFISSCQRGSPLFSTRNPIKSRLTETADWASKRRQGVDFMAVGTSLVTTPTEPVRRPDGPTERSPTERSPTERSPTERSPTSWWLEIDFSKQMLFQSLNGPELLMPMPKPQPIGKSMGVLLDSRSAPIYASASRRSAVSRSSPAKSNRLKVSIEPIACCDPLTNRDYAYTVRIDANGKRYVGCGSFIKGSDRLNGEWILETFRGQRLRPDQFAEKALPFLAIDLSRNKLTGSTGWNKIKGDIHADGDHLTIDPKITTRKPSSGTFEADLLESLRQSSLFRIGKDRLTLLVSGQYAMTFRKK